MAPAPELSPAPDPADFPEDYGRPIGRGGTDADGDLYLGIDANQKVLGSWINGHPSDLRLVLWKGPGEVEAVVKDGSAHSKSGMDQSPVAGVQRGLQPVPLDLDEKEVFWGASRG